MSKKILKLSLVGVLALGLLAGCGKGHSRSSNQAPTAVEKPALKHFKKAYNMESSNIFISGEGSLIQSASILYGNGSSRALMITAYFWPAKLIRIETKGSEPSIVPYSTADEEYKGLWDVLYQQALEESESQGWSIPSPYAGDVANSSKEYEEQIANLTERVEKLTATETQLQTALAEAGEANATLQATLDTVRSEKANLEAELATASSKYQELRTTVENIKNSLKLVTE